MLRGDFEFEFNLKKVHIIIGVGLVLLLGSLLFVGAYNSQSTPDIFGHTLNEIDGIPVCSQGEVLSFDGASMNCVTLSGESVLAKNLKVDDDITVVAGTCDNAIRVEVIYEGIRLAGGDEEFETFRILDNNLAMDERNIVFGSWRSGSSGAQWLYNMENSNVFYILDVENNHTLSGDLVDNDNIFAASIQWHVTCI